MSEAFDVMAVPAGYPCAIRAVKTSSKSHASTQMKTRTGYAFGGT